MKPYQMLIDGKQKEVRNLSIHYNTNLSVIKYDEESLIDLWRGFSRVYLSISCDGIGKVGEYQRTGFDTKRFEENLKTIKKYGQDLYQLLKVELVLCMDFNIQQL